MTQRDDDEAPKGGRSRRAREDAPKERVLHTRVPAVLEQELKRLAHSLRVPVSNVVRAILEDAVDAVDTVSERAEGELLGFVDRLARQRDELHRKVHGDKVDDRAPAPAKDEEPQDAAIVSELPCPAEPPELLEGVYGYQPIVLATETRCSVCGRDLAAGSDALRALFDEPGKRVFLGSECRLVPEKRSGS